MVSGLLSWLVQKAPGSSAIFRAAFNHVEDELLGGAPAFAGRQRQLGAESGHMVELVAAERVGGDDAQAIAFRRADEGERGAGAAAGVFDDKAIGLEPAIAFGAFDDGLGHPILHAARRVLPFELDEDSCAAGRRHPAQRDQRGFADRLERARVCHHGCFSV